MIFYFWWVLAFAGLMLLSFGVSALISWLEER